MTIHSDHPFASPEGERDQVRRFRGRTAGQVSLWTTGTETARVGLTVSSYFVALGEPAWLVGVIDPDSDLGDALREEGTRFVSQLLDWHHRDLAEQFAGLMPAPGGPFAAAEWTSTPSGPRLADATAWLECEVGSTREIGWSLEVTARIDAAAVGDDLDPLGHRRGRYTRLDR